MTISISNTDTPSGLDAPWCIIPRSLSRYIYISTCKWSTLSRSRPFQRIIYSMYMHAGGCRCAACCIDIHVVVNDDYSLGEEFASMNRVAISHPSRNLLPLLERTMCTQRSDDSLYTTTIHCRETAGFVYVWTLVSLYNREREREGAFLTKRGSIHWDSVIIINQSAVDSGA